jgi:phage tail tape-measure protein
MVAPASHLRTEVRRFIRMLAETKEDVALNDHPQVIGDTFEEIVESMNRIADAGEDVGDCAAK